MQSSNNIKDLNKLFGKNYTSQEDFFKDISNISTKSLINFLEVVSQTPDTDSSLISRIVTHLDMRAREGTLTLKLAQRIFAIPFPHFKNEKKENPSPFNRIQLTCQTSDANESAFLLNQMLLCSSSSILKTMFKAGLKESSSNLLALPPGIKRDTRRHLKEFLEKGYISQCQKLSPAQMQELIELANLWQMKDLLNYLANYISVDDKNFDGLVHAALEAQALGLFKVCLSSRFGEKYYIKLDCKNFDHLTLKISKYDDKEETKLIELGQFLSQMPQIRQLEIIPAWSIKSKINFTCLKPLQGFITSANLFHCERTWDESIEFLGQCPKLQSATLPRIHNWDINSLNQTIEMCTKNCADFQSLHLYLSVNVRLKEIRSLSSFPQTAKFIKTLNFSENRELEDDDTEYLVKTCPNLEELNLYLCSQITDKSLEFIAKYCPKLQELNLANCHEISGKGLKALTEGCKELRILNLDYSFDLKDVDVEILKSFQKLEEFYFNSYDRKITDTGLLTIAQCPLLINLRLPGTYTEEGLQKFAQSSSKIKSLYLKLESEMNDHKLEIILKECNEIENLNLAHAQITNESLINMARIAPIFNF